MLVVSEIFRIWAFLSGVGVAHTLATVSWGRRWSIANSYLLPAMNRDNLHVATGAHVNRVSHCLIVCYYVPYFILLFISFIK